MVKIYSLRSTSSSDAHYSQVTEGVFFPDVGGMKCVQKVKVSDGVGGDKPETGCRC